MQKKQVKFAESISNESLAELPLVKFEGGLVVVESEEQIEEACRELMQHTVIGFDTETRPNFKPGPMNRIALLQLSTPDKCFLFRLCRIPLTRPLIRILESKKVLKVGAGLDNDLIALKKITQFRPNGFIDIQNLVPEWGISDKSLRKITGIVLGGRISKAQRLSNWEATQLTTAQQNYASTDAWVCLNVYHKLSQTHKPAGIVATVGANERVAVKEAPVPAHTQNLEPGKKRSVRSKRNHVSERTSEIKGSESNHAQGDNSGNRSTRRNIKNKAQNSGGHGEKDSNSNKHTELNKQARRATKKSVAPPKGFQQKASAAKQQHDNPKPDEKSKDNTEKRS